MKRTLTLFLIMAVLLVMAHRLPAPISEESPTPVPEQSVKPKLKRLTEAKTNRNAQYVLGVAYENGIYGVPLDHEKARQLLVSAAAAGQQDAKTILDASPQNPIPPTH